MHCLHLQEYQSRPCSVGSYHAISSLAYKDHPTLCFSQLQGTDLTKLILAALGVSRARLSTRRTVQLEQESNFGLLKLRAPIMSASFANIPCLARPSVNSLRARFEAVKGHQAVLTGDGRISLRERVAALREASYETPMTPTKGWDQECPAAPVKSRKTFHLRRLSCASDDDADIHLDRLAAINLDVGSRSSSPSPMHEFRLRHSITSETSNLLCGEVKELSTRIGDLDNSVEVSAAYESADKLF
jgi:hypothetical protein